MNKRRKNYPNRKSTRLKAYDYSQPGSYFVTLVTHDRKQLFGEVLNGEMLLNALGKSIARAWVWLGTQYPYVEVDEYVIMPNHLHGIISFFDSGERRKPLGQLIGAFKTKPQSTEVVGGRMWKRGREGAPLNLG